MKYRLIVSSYYHIIAIIIEYIIVNNERSKEPIRQMNIYIFIVLVLPTKSVLKHTVHDKHRLVWGPYTRGVTGQLPNVPMR
jgi:hypothetical protein